MLALVSTSKISCAFWPCLDRFFFSMNGCVLFNFILMSEATLGRDLAQAARVQDRIQGRDRDYGNVLWQQPHLLDLSYLEL